MFFYIIHDNICIIFWTFSESFILNKMKKFWIFNLGHTIPDFNSVPVCYYTVFDSV